MWDIFEEDFEESLRDNHELCRDILKENGEEIVSRHYVLCSSIKAEDKQMNSVMTRVISAQKVLF